MGQAEFWEVTLFICLTDGQGPTVVACTCELSVY